MTLDRKKLGPIARKIKSAIDPDADGTASKLLMDKLPDSTKRTYYEGAGRLLAIFQVLGDDVETIERENDISLDVLVELFAKRDLELDQRQQKDADKTRTARAKRTNKMEARQDKLRAEAEAWGWQEGNGPLSDKDWKKVKKAFRLNNPQYKENPDNKTLLADARALGLRK